MRYPAGLALRPPADQGNWVYTDGKASKVADENRIARLSYAPGNAAQTVCRFLE